MLTLTLNICTLLRSYINAGKCVCIDFVNGKICMYIHVYIIYLYLWGVSTPSPATSLLCHHFLRVGPGNETPLHTVACVSLIYPKCYCAPHTSHCPSLQHSQQQLTGDFHYSLSMHFLYGVSLIGVYRSVVATAWQPMGYDSYMEQHEVVLP